MHANFYYHPRLLKYTFPDGHVYNSRRLAMAVERIEGLGIAREDFADATREDLLTVHDEQYVDHLELCGRKPGSGVKRPSLGIGTSDTPAFLGMWDASLAVCGASKAAAEALCRGAEHSFNLAGGLHHAKEGWASGFCAANDIGLAIKTLRGRFDRVAYVDIDLHHGDGPEAMFVSDPSVLTASIHEWGGGFYPGTGTDYDLDRWVVNVPLAAGTGGQFWLGAFRQYVLEPLLRFDPRAIVLQLGTDAHESDPLGHLRVTAREWLEAVKDIRDLGKPTLYLGGGGYDHRNPARMWPAAVATVARVPHPEEWLDDPVATYASQRESEELNKARMAKLLDRSA